MKYLVISLIFFSNNLFSQQIYLGMPVNNVTLNSEDIIIIEEIEWQGSFTQFSEIGMKQIEELDSFLLIWSKKKSIEVQVHSFYGQSKEMNFKISTATIRALKEKMNCSQEILNQITFKAMGSSQPLSSSVEVYGKLLGQLNSRIEIYLHERSD